MHERHPLGPYVRRFLTENIGWERRLSRHTQTSYRDTIRLLLRFVALRCHMDAVGLTLEMLDREAVRAFLVHLEQDRGNAAASRNQRLAAIRSFFRYVGAESPELIEHAATILGIPFQKAPHRPVPYLEKDEMDAVLAAPDRGRPQGRREYALLLFLYNTGARAGEASHVSLGDLHLDGSPAVRLQGKGTKTRHCPLWVTTVEVLRRLIGERLQGSPDSPVFVNVRRQRMTRFGIHRLVARVARKASARVPALAKKKVGPHTIRHSTAVHLLRAGVDINTIRSWLGHVSVDTTSRYAEVDLESKAKALAACAVPPSRPDVEDRPLWRGDAALMDFLDNL
jgi:site-specific recombinase XerD